MASIPIFVGLFGERSLTPVAAVFGNPHQALHAARSLRRQPPLQGVAVDVLHPDDPDVEQKMGPDGRGIESATWGKRALLGAVGAVAVAGPVALWPAASASPGLTVLFAVVLGAFAAMLLAGLQTLRPGRRQVALQVKEALRDGHWAVVAYSIDEADARRASDSLRRNGGEVLRSF